MRDPKTYRSPRRVFPPLTRKTNPRGISAAWQDSYDEVHVVAVDERGRNFSRTHWEKRP